MYLVGVQVIMSKNELDKRLGLMSSLGVTAKHQQYLFECQNIPCICILLVFVCPFSVTIQCLIDFFSYLFVLSFPGIVLLPLLLSRSRFFCRFRISLIAVLS